MAWGSDSDAPGLLAAGGDLSVDTIANAYTLGIFPWYSAGQPILWWSPSPRMVLQPMNFKLHRSLRKKIAALQKTPGFEIRFDSAFAEVIGECANAKRSGQPGTWIVTDMVAAYIRMHKAGMAHSVETWINGELAGGLYCVAIGQAVFGESMFCKVSDASKIALAALVAFCRHSGINLIDCQQNTAHLASMGAAEIPRDQFLHYVEAAAQQLPSQWKFDPLYWDTLLAGQHPES
jgi:leucyl/phenylalanyl-tRNA--protein transferase